MPDAFAGVAALAVALLLAAGARMRWPERGFWIANLILAALFHKAVLAMAVVMAIVLVVVGLRSRLSTRGEIGVVAGALVLAVAGTLAMDALASFVGRAPTSPPFLLARVIGDGPGGRVLREDCPARPLASCRFVAGLPMTENQFLWDAKRVTPWSGQPDDVRRQVTAEQQLIVGEVLRRYPGAQLVQSARNGFGQLVNTDLTEFREYRLQTMRLLGFAGFEAERESVARSRMAAPSFPLDALSSLWLTIYVAAAMIAVAGAAWPSAGAGEDVRRIRYMVAALLLALLVNAFVNGVVSGSMGRYQARLSWLAVLGLVVVVNLWLAPVAGVRRRQPQASRPSSGAPSRRP